MTTSHLLDELGLVLEPVPDERQLAAEDLPVHALLDLAQKVIQPVHHRPHVGEQVDEVELPFDVGRVGERDGARDVRQVRDRHRQRAQRLLTSGNSGRLAFARPVRPTFTGGPLRRMARRGRSNTGSTAYPSA